MLNQLMHTHSVLVTLYNLGTRPSGDPLIGATFDTCFKEGLDDASNSGIVTRFRSRDALRLSLDGLELSEMFNRNIGPASSIGDEDRDPTLRPIILGSWSGEQGGGRLVVAK